METRSESQIGADAAANTSSLLSVAIGGTVHGAIGVAGDHDFIAVTLLAGQTYSFAMVGIGAQAITDTVLKLYGPDGTTQLAVNDDGLPNSNSILTFTATQSGTHFLDAAGFGTQMGSYGVSATLGTKADFDLDMIAGATDTHLGWSARGTGTDLTFGFRESSTRAGFSPFTEGEKQAVRETLAHYAELTLLTFTEVNPGGLTNNATLLYGNYSAIDGAGATGGYPGNRDAASGSGDVWVNDSSPPVDLPEVGSWFREMLLHEVGHSMGLSHPGKYNAGVGITITYAANAQFLQDSAQYTVMSYFEADATGGPDNYADTLMLADILALQIKYGANMATRTGDTTYGFGSTAGDVYDFAINTDPHLTIWDAGGVDTLNASRYSMGQSISLVAGTFSSIGGYSNNVSVAYGATLERALGGRGADLIIGNAAANVLTGGLSDDTLQGDAGNDRLLGGSGGDHLIGGAGNDTLIADDPAFAGQVPEVFDLVATDKSEGSRLRASNIDLFPTGSFTIELVWKQHDLVDQHYSMSIGNIGLYRYDDGNTGLIFWNAPESGWNYGIIPTHMTDGQPHRLSLTYDDATGEFHVYLDGSESWSTTFTPGTRALTALGNLSLDDDASYGDIRIFDHARSATQIWDNALGTLADPASEVGLVQNWVGDGAGHLVSTLPGKDALISVGATTSEQAALWSQTTANVMEGGTGNDSYTVTTSDDTVIELAGQGTDTVTARVDFTLTAGSAVEKLVVAAGVSPVHLTGNELANTLTSGAGADTLQGGGGRDALYGGKDAGAADHFVFADVTDSAVGALRDRVYGFVSGQDVIDLSQIDSDLAQIGDQAFAFVASAAANALWFVSTTAGLILRGDVSGDARADMEIGLMGVTAVVAGDFVL